MSSFQSAASHKNWSRQRVARHVLAFVSLLSASLATACGGSDNTLTSSKLASANATSLVTVSGDAQTATIGTALAQSLTVRATTASGTAVSGVTVTFQVASGSATLSPSNAVTDSSGQAHTQVTAGTVAGTVVVSATTTGLVTTSFTETITSATVTTACTPTSLAVGGVAVIAGTTACVTGGTAASEYALIPFNAGTTAATRATVAVKASGVTAVTTTLTTTSLTSDASSVLSAGSASSGLLSASNALAAAGGRQAFEVGLRSRERDAMTSRLTSARSWQSSSRSGTGARLNVIPSTATVGQIYSLNANANVACSSPSYRAGRIVAVGKTAIVVADTLNPAGGFTNDEYTAIAATFDDVVDAVDTRNFGQPTDIDGNGHVILFFTSAVNALTPRNANYYIGGFFYGRDLLPTTGTSTLTACAGSNVAEMFYLLVPDPNGTINGNTFSKSFVSSATISTTGHEFQHLINASRRLYVNTGATDFEETFLDEGLAHVAEELVFYARSGLAPLANISATLLRSNSTYLSTFNDDGISNFGRLTEFLQAPTINSPYADNDSLATRGATWSFLRYATDQQSATQSTVWYNLVNSTTTGLSNLRQVYGDLTPLFRDWSTSLLMDDVSGSASRYQFLSWNLRSIFGALNSGAYPISTGSLPSDATTSVSIGGGGVAYLRFGVAASGTGSLSWTSNSSSMQYSLVRLK